MIFPPAARFNQVEVKLKESELSQGEVKLIEPGFAEGEDEKKIRICSFRGPDLSKDKLSSKNQFSEEEFRKRNPDSIFPPASRFNQVEVEPK